MRKGISREEERLLKNFDRLTKLISKGETAPVLEKEDDKMARIESLKQDYSAFCQYYFAHYLRNKEGKIIANADFHNKLANDVLKNKIYYGFVEWFRGSAKSTHVDIFLPMFLMAHKEINFMLLVGVNAVAAKVLLQGIQFELSTNKRYIADYGEQITYGSWADDFFTTQNGVSFKSLGIGQSPRGARVISERPDYIVCDDTDTEKMAKNPALIKETVEWIEGALIGTMDNKNERFIFANNRISEKGILAVLQKNHSDWKASKIDALDKNGKVTWSAKYNKDYFARKLQNMGMRAYQREYMNKPSVSAGVFKEEQILYKKPLENWSDYDAMVMYCDPSFSTSITSDYTAIKLWAIKGKDLICLKAYCRQDESIEKALKWWQKFLDSLPIMIRLKIKCYIESNATQKLLVQDALNKLPNFLGIQFDKDYKGDKADRIAAMIPAYEQGLVSYSLFEKSDPDMLTSIQMLLEWTEKGSSHDDSPDADAGAWSKLQIKPRPQSVAVHSTIKRYR